MPDKEANEYAQAYVNSVIALNALKQQASSAECTMKTAETALAKHLLPKNANPEMTYGIWSTIEIGREAKNVLVLVEPRWKDVYPLDHGEAVGQPRRMLDGYTITFDPKIPGL